MTIVAQNKKAWHEYHIIETYEAGISLHGDEVKSMRAGHCSLVDSFARVDEGQPFVYKMNIPQYMQAGHFKSDTVRTRRLLLNKKEIRKLAGATQKKGFTIIPLKVYFNDKGFIKIELGLCQGKKLHDRRADLKDAAVKRDIARGMTERKG
jgi:SsrA-binding protein